MIINSKKTLRHVFLEQFNNSIRSEIIEFGKRLSKIEADYFIFMARKSVCFYECLNALRLASISGIATTDRILDMDIAWLRGRRVALIDDALISGTSLYRINKQLSSAGAKIVGHIVFCVDAEWWNKDTFNPTEPFLRLSHDETTTFCSDLVRAISLVPHPYAVDYPVYKRLRITDGSVQDIFNQPEWQVRNISTPAQVTMGAISLVAVPSSALVSRLSEDIGLELRSIAQLMKVRLYGRRIEKHEATWFTAMPIVVLDPLTIESLNQLWNGLARSWTAEQLRILKRIMVNESAKLRFLQFLISTRLTKAWLSDLRNMTGERITARMDQNSIRYAFSPNLALTLAECCDRPFKFDLPSSIHSTTIKNREPSQTSPKMSGGDPWCMQARLIEPFLSLYCNEEIPARRLVKTLGRKAFKSPKNQELLNRLNRGFTISELRDLAHGSDDGRSPAEILSEFLDYAIDRGFVVPTTVVRNGIVYRAYRHGEDIPDSEEFRLLVATSVSNFLKSANIRAIPGVWLEKMIVLLLQAVVEKNYIPPSDLALGEAGTIGVRYALHGAVVKEDATRIYSHYDGFYYSKVLSGVGILKEVKGGDDVDDKSEDNLPQIETDLKDSFKHQYRIQNMPEGVPCKPAAKELAEGIGIIFGCLYSGRFGFKISKNDITSLATCFTPSSTASSLAAELDIFRKEWRYVKAKIMTNFTNSGSALRRQLFFTAINSARFKYRIYMTGKNFEIIEDVQRKIDSQETLDALFFSSKWRALWSDRIGSNQHSEEDPCSVLARELGKITYELNILTRCLQFSLLEKVDGKKEIYHEIEELAREYDMITKAYRTKGQDYINISEPMVKALKRLKSEFGMNGAFVDSSQQIDWTKFKQWAITQISYRVANIPSRLELVDAIAARYGKPNEFERFEHVLFIEFPHSLEDQKRAILRFDKHYKSAYVTAKKQDRTYLSSIPLRNVDIEDSRLVFARGEFAARELIKFSLGWARCSEREKSTRMIFFRNLPVDEQPIRVKMTDKFCISAFYQRLSTVLRNPQLSDSDPSELLIIAPVETSPKEFISIARSSGLLPETSSTASFIFADPVERRFDATAYSIQNTSTKKRSRGGASPVIPADVGLICMTPTELAAVLDSMKVMEGYAEDERFTFYSARANGDECSLRIGFTASISKGNVSVTSAYRALVEKYRPKLVVLIGMAGGIHKDVSLCDVVIGDQIYYYQPRKSRPTGDTHRGSSHMVHPNLLRLLTHFQAKHGSGLPKFESELGAPSNQFKVHVGPIGTGEEVVGYKDSETKKWLQEVNDTTLAVETEAWGLTTCYYEADAWSSVVRNPVNSVLVIRGVADHADVKKDSELQYCATKHALKTLTYLLHMIQPSDLEFVERK